jgi:hypothetical protein
MEMDNSVGGLNIESIPIGNGLVNQNISINHGKQSRIVKGVQQNHRFEGYSEEEPLTFVGIRVNTSEQARYLKGKSGKNNSFYSILYGWDFGLIASVTLTVVLRDERTSFLRAVIPQGNSSLLERGEVRLFFVYKDKIIAESFLNIPTNNYDNNKVFIQDLLNRNIHPSLRRIASIRTWDSMQRELNPQEMLELGWAEKYHYQLENIIESKKSILCSFPSDTDQLSPTLKEFIDNIIDCEFETSRILDLLISDNKDPAKTLLELSEYQQEFEEYCHERTGHKHCGFLKGIIHLLAIDPLFTDFGSSIPYVNAQGSFDKIKIDIPSIPQWLSSRDYWNRLSNDILFRTGLLVDGTQTPCDSSVISNIWSKFPQVEDIAQNNDTAHKLLQEALGEKQWCIPPKALVEFEIGPFKYFEITELENEVHFIGRTSDFQYMQFIIEPREGHFWAPVPMHEGEAIKASIFLPLVAILRDFWVQEDRNVTFSTRIKKTPRSTANPKTTDDRVVYLPRVFYSRTADTPTLLDSLSLKSYAKHTVREHLRKASHPSDSQLELAKFFNVYVPSGFTFVRPHARGNENKRIIYKSRSAMKLLYTSSGNVEVSSSDWYLFELKVAELFKSQGYSVIHTASARNGDQGIDVSAIKRIGSKEERVIAQCKCYRLNRPIGPSVVRELIGSLADLPSDTSGIIITTSYFTSEAILIAERHNIKCIGGSDFYIRDGFLETESPL